MNDSVCPKCGSTSWRRGEFYPAGVLWDVCFRSEDALQVCFKKVTTALACVCCGYVELYMSDHEDSKT